jgi:hypothetical protein
MSETKDIILYQICRNQLIEKGLWKEGEDTIRRGRLEAPIGEVCRAYSWLCGQKPKQRRQRSIEASVLALIAEGFFTEKGYEHIIGEQDPYKYLSIRTDAILLAVKLIPWIKCRGGFIGIDIHMNLIYVSHSNTFICDRAITEEDIGRFS